MNLTEEQKTQMKALHEKHREEIKALREKHQQEVKAILTDEQWKKLQEMKPQRPQGMGGRKGEMMRDRMMDDGPDDMEK